MNHDMALVAKVLETGDYKGAVKAGIKPTLLGARAALFWDVLTEYYDQHHQIPSVDFFKGLCPDYEHHPPTDTVDMLIGELKTLHLGNEINTLLGQIIESNSVDPWKAKNLLIQLSDKVNSEHQVRNTRTQVGDKADYVLKMLSMLRDGSGMLGIEWPFDGLNQRTPGIMPGNVIYFYGRHKSKKTWLMLFMALFFEHMGYRVLFFTREMSVEELHFRLAALIIGISLDDFSKGNVTDETMADIKEIMAEIQARGRFMISDNTDGLPGYKAEVDDFQPDIVMHDYWKAMADDAMDGKYNTSEKRYVDRTIDMLVDYHAKIKTPVIICGHANREGDKSKGKSSTEHAWSDHIVRRIHGAIRVVKSNDERYMGLVINAGRAIPEDIMITLDGNLCYGFGDELNVDPSWIFNDDDAQVESKKSHERKQENASDAAKIPVGARAFKPQSKGRKKRKNA
jgi:hypothetical protein